METMEVGDWLQCKCAGLGQYQPQARKAIKYSSAMAVIGMIT